MAATADVSSVSAWSKVPEPRPRKPKQPGRYVHQFSSDYRRVSHSRSTDVPTRMLILLSKLLSKIETALSESRKSAGQAFFAGPKGTTTAQQSAC
eukprot:1866486-Amphidinium_carterae.1